MPVYACIDLKSFYASVECTDRRMDPLNTNLVVADASRTEKTICLAVSPALKAIGVPGRPRLFEVVQKVQQENMRRLQRAPGHRFTGGSCFADALARDSSLKLEYVIAPPKMARYIKVSTEIFQIYLGYVSPEDIYIYSVDEAFLDLTNYLDSYQSTAHDLVLRMVRDVVARTGITATAGIGSNLYLAKIAMDIVAKKMPADEDGVRIAELDEMSYRRQLWSHRPLTDFWRIGSGTARKLEREFIYTMGDLARYSEWNAAKLYKLFGVNAELLIDHAWGWEPCTLAAIKGYRPENHSVSQGQVLPGPYSAEMGRLICREMTEQLVLDLVSKGLVCDQLVLTVGYDDSGIPENFDGVLEQNRYGKTLPKQAHGSVNLGKQTASSMVLTAAAVQLWDRIVDSRLLVRRMYVVANHVIPEQDAKSNQPLQYGLFEDAEAAERRQKKEESAQKREKSLQKAVISLKGRYGKNAVLKGMNLEEGATAVERNKQVGGHRA